MSRGPSRLEHPKCKLKFPSRLGGFVHRCPDGTWHAGYVTSSGGHAVSGYSKRDAVEQATERAHKIAGELVAAAQELQS